MIHDGPFMTVADIQHLLTISRRTLYRWATEDQWGHRTGRPAHYCFNCASMSKQTHHGSNMRAA